MQVGRVLSVLHGYTVPIYSYVESLICLFQVMRVHKIQNVRFMTELYTTLNPTSPINTPLQRTRLKWQRKDSHHLHSCELKRGKNWNPFDFLSPPSTHVIHKFYAYSTSFGTVYPSSILFASAYKESESGILEIGRRRLRRLL